MAKKTKLDYIQYLDIDVLEASKQRIRHIFETFDDWYVCFSGGKDSWAMLNVAETVRKEMGIEGKLKVVFRDEELIPDVVVQFVNQVRESGRFDLRYYCIPLESEKYVLGNKESYIQWDSKREWIRPKPDYAITTDKVMSQYTADEFITQDGKGKIALLIGIRADESLMRMSGILSKKNESYISDSGVAHIKKCKPIYDWTEKDVFKYFYDHHLPYCQAYDFQMFAGARLRVSTPLHAEASKELHRLKAMYPTFYTQLCALFPDIIVQERYFKEYDRYGIIDKYPRSWQGILQYIKENITDPYHQKKAREVVLSAMKNRYNSKSKESPYGGYPLLYVFKSVVNGAYKRKLLPKSKATQKEIEYEKGGKDAL